MTGHPELEQKLRDAFARDEVPPGLFDRVERALAGSEVAGPALSTSGPQGARGPRQRDGGPSPSRQVFGFPPLAGLWKGFAVSGWAVAALLLGLLVLPRPDQWQVSPSQEQGELDEAAQSISSALEANQSPEDLSRPPSDNTLKVGPGETPQGQAESGASGAGGYRNAAFHPDQGVINYTGLFPADFDTEGDHEQLPPLADRIFGDRHEFAPSIPDDVLTSYVPGEGRFLTWHGRPAVAVDLEPRAVAASAPQNKPGSAPEGARLFIVLAQDGGPSFFGRVPTEFPTSFEWQAPRSEGAAAGGSAVRSGRIWREGNFVYIIVERD